MRAAAAYQPQLNPVHIDVSLNGQELLALLDTGFDTCQISTKGEELQPTRVLAGATSSVGDYTLPMEHTTPQSTRILMSVGV